MEYIVGVIINGLFWGFVCSKVAENKGYGDEGWYFWGFLFSVVALIVLLVKPNISYTKYHYDDQGGSGNSWDGRSTLFQDQRAGQAAFGMPRWKCAWCGRENDGIVGTCACGKTKQDTEEKLRNAEVQRNCSNTDESSTDSKFANIDAIKKYKELLDMGAITQEEFDKKKAELL